MDFSPPVDKYFQYSHSPLQYSDVTDIHARVSELCTFVETSFNVYAERCICSPPAPEMSRHEFMVHLAPQLPFFVRRCLQCVDDMVETYLHTFYPRRHQRRPAPEGMPAKHELEAFVGELVAFFDQFASQYIAIYYMCEISREDALDYWKKYHTDIRNEMEAFRAPAALWALPYSNPELLTRFVAHVQGMDKFQKYIVGARMGVRGKRSCAAQNTAFLREMFMQKQEQKDK